MPEIVPQDDQIAALAPSLFATRPCSPEIDLDVREKFYRVYKPLRDGGTSAYFLSRVCSALYYYRPFLSRLLKPTRTKNVLEIGCGLGWKGLCWADLFASYVGIELSAESAAGANDQFKKFGLTNARAISGNAEAILQQPERYGLPQVDVLVLYAVVEHLTIPERRSILRLAQEVYLRGGAVLIAESPNRLCRFDSHTWQQPFTDWLPEELMEAYAAKKLRPLPDTSIRTNADLAGVLKAAAPDQKHEVLARLGRGISFHEFESFWDEAVYDNMTVRNDGYSPELLNLYPVLRDEIELLNFFRHNDINAHRVFTRYWVEGLFMKVPDGQVNKSAIYLDPRQIGFRHPNERRRHYELDEAALIPGGAESISIDNPKQYGGEVLLVIDLTRSSGRLLVEEKQSGTRFEIDLERIRAGRLPIWHNQATLPLGPATEKGYRVKAAGKNCTVFCQGAFVV